nr:hypothetical protein OG461_05600 [Streptomyces sp. NBC_00995]
MADETKTAWCGNVIGGKKTVTAFVIRRFVERGRLSELSLNLYGSLLPPGPFQTAQPTFTERPY